MWTNENRAKHTMRSIVIGAGAAALWVMTIPAGAVKAQDFYKGKTLTIVVGFTAGGGFDANARLLARHLSDHVAGHPNVVVANMPGAASMVAVNYLDAAAPRDGTVITAFNFGQIGDSRVRPEEVKADFRTYNWLGSIGEDPAFCYASQKLGIKTLAELAAHGTFHMGLTAVGGSSDIDQKILKKIFGVDVQQIAGYPGSAEERLAIERGEIDGDCGAWSDIPPDWIEDRKIVALLNLASFRPAGMPESVPFAVDIAPNTRDRSIIQLLTASAQVGRPFIASRAVPADRMKILRDAFAATMKDPAFVADAAKLHLPVAPKDAEEAQKIVEDIYMTSDDIVQDARKIVAE